MAQGRPQLIHARCRLCACLAVVVASLCVQQLVGFVSSVKVARLRLEGPRSISAITRRVSFPVGASGQSLIIKVPKAKGFDVAQGERPNAREIQPVKAEISLQRTRFFAKVKNGKHVSEVFIRVEGGMPWKRVGEITHSFGDFEESVRCQYPILMSHAYYLIKKFRYWAQSTHKVYFGYTDSNAEIVTVDAGPLPLGTSNLEFKALLKRCGFNPASKPRKWRKILTNLRDTYETKKDWHRNNKGRLLDRQTNLLPERSGGWNPHKVRGNVNPHPWWRKSRDKWRKKRGQVIGAGFDSSAPTGWR
eukprot:TRINITY_DN34169_c0_g1_i1.p1 TRINITY_DN34169_c0_g1~~TRINITY_DN34169_c0_g1_i1.p1  ORF type:complete len:304 (-),score=33.94 TRINITY_DN34169_c0_g1_i1:48-959(-)